MGGIQCAKTIIDQRNALVQQLDCMVASIHLNSTITQPNEKHEEEFVAACNALAKVAAVIESYVRS